MVNFNLDLAKHDNFAKAFTARQGDAGEQFQVTLFDNQVPYTPASGDVLSLRVVTPTGKFASVAGTVNGNKVVFTLTGQVTSEAGYYKRAYIAVSNGTKLRTTQDLIFFSLGNSDINKGQADYYVAELDKLLQQLNEEFDQWLIDREADYSDLLARIVALNNRVTGLETKLDDILAQLQANMISTTNLFDLSLITQPESQLRRRHPESALEVLGWGIEVMSSANVKKLGLVAGKTYHGHLKATLLDLKGGTARNDASQMGWVFYSGVSGYPSIWIARTTGTQIPDIIAMTVGDSIEYETTFTLPDNFYDSAANYRMLMYSRRDETTGGIVDPVLFEQMTIQEGSMYTGFQNDPDNTLTKFDENRLKKSVLVDPKMTGLNPPVIENGSNGSPTTSISYNTAGYLDIQNLNPTGRSRVYWSASMLGLDVPDSKQTFNVTLKVRSTRTLEPLEVGYSGLTTNPKLPLTYEWQTLSATIQAGANTALCLYLGANSAINISEMYVFPANTDITSNRIERIETNHTNLERLTIGNPVILSNADVNTLVDGGNYVLYNATNVPNTGSGIYWYLQVFPFDNTNRNYMQILTMRSGTRRRYIRQKVNDTWGEWRWIPELYSDGRVDTFAVDFNTLVESGSFVNTSATNSPDGAASTSWYTDVIRYGSSGNYVYQRATKISNINQDTYERQLFNGTWTVWRRISSPYIDQMLGTPSDANKITTTQNIQLEATATANLPTSGTGVYYYLEAIARADNYVLQRATLRGTTFKVYVRQSHNGTWTAWREMAFA